MILGQVQFRRDTAANWTSNNPVLLSGEMGIETDTQKFKLGNGTSNWNSLAYGGIKGDTGATGNTGATGATGAAGTNGWSPILAVESDGERRVLRLVDWTGGTGTKPATGSYLGPSGFVATAAQATDIRGPQGATGVTPTQNTFATVQVGTTPTPTLLQADTAADSVTINAGAGITLTADAATDTMSIANSGVTSVTAGTGIAVSAATGALTVTNTLPGYVTTTLAAPTASFSTAVTTIVSQAIAGGSIVAGSMFQFRVRAQVINTIAASNLVCTISIGAVNVLVQTQAMGTTARAAPGGAVIIEGTISFSSATAAEATSRAFTSSAVAFDAAAATAAAVTVATAAATTADIKLNSSAATTTVIVREASLIRIK